MAAGGQAGTTGQANTTGRPNTTLWHYTIRQRFEQIVAEGVIRPSTQYALRAPKAAVWFSTNQQWDPSANKSLLLADESRRVIGRDEMHAIGSGPMRFGVAPGVAPLNWHDFKRESGLSAKLVHAMTAAAIQLESKPSWWFATFEPVLRNQWVAIEQWDGWQWTAL